MLPETPVLLRLLLAQVLQRLEQPATQRTLDVPDRAVGLHGLARHVEWDIGRVHDPLDETQIFREQVLVVFLDQDLARVELQPVIGRDRNRPVSRSAGT